MNSACANEIRPRSDSPSSRDARTYGHTDRQTDRHLSFIYIDVRSLYCEFAVHGVSTALATSQGSSQAC